jgi:hypothetical protein
MLASKSLQIAEAAMHILQESRTILEERASMFPKTVAQIETPPDWENQNYGGTGDAFKFDSVLDAGLDFDTINSGPVGAWGDHS